MRHRRGIDLIPDKGAIDPDCGIGHLRLADLADNQLLGARCSKCDHNQWVDRWRLAGKYGHDVTLDELRPLLKCTRCGNREGNGLRIGRAHRDMTNRARPSTEVFPDKPGPVIRNTADGERELVNLTWGMPSPPFVTKGKPDYGVTNIRNVDSPHWRRWLEPQYRCIVPWTAFCEYEDTKPKKTARWFSLDASEPLAFFAGIWTPWKGERGSMKNPRAGDHELFGFLTCDANEVVKPIHSNAMPVILTEPAEVELWMTADWKDAKALQRPFSAEKMMLQPVERQPMLL